MPKPNVPAVRIRRRYRSCLAPPRSWRGSWLLGAVWAVFWTLSSQGTASAQRVMPIEEQIAQAFVLSDLEAYLVFSGVASEMRDDDREFTMLALTNEGWSDVPYARKLQTPQWRAHTASFLRRYIHEESVVNGESTGGPYSASRTLTMLDGSEIMVEVTGSRPTFDGVRHVASAECTNGYLYMLGWSASDWPDPAARYLAPAWEEQSIAEAIAALPSGSDPERSYAIVKDIVAQYISNDGEYAVNLLEAEPTTDVAMMFLAPTDAAFARAGFGFRQAFCGSMASADAMAELEALVQGHILQTVLPSSLTVPQQAVTTASGKSWTWRRPADVEVPTLTDGEVSVELMSSEADQLSIAGIVHGVDTLLWKGAN